MDPAPLLINILGGGCANRRSRSFVFAGILIMVLGFGVRSALKSGSTEQATSNRDSKTILQVYPNRIRTRIRNFSVRIRTEGSYNNKLAPYYIPINTGCIANLEPRAED